MAASWWLKELDLTSPRLPPLAPAPAPAPRPRSRDPVTSAAGGEDDLIILNTVMPGPTLGHRGAPPPGCSPLPQQ